MNVTHVTLSTVAWVVNSSWNSLFISLYILKYLRSSCLHFHRTLKTLVVVLLVLTKQVSQIHPSPAIIRLSPPAKHIVKI